jgi:hypothetical protein
MTEWIEEQKKNVGGRNVIAKGERIKARMKVVGYIRRRVEGGKNK